MKGRATGMFIRLAIGAALVCGVFVQNARAGDLRIEPFPGSIIQFDFDHKISADGRFVVYRSLYAGFSSIHIRDRRTGSTELVSRSSLGEPANDISGGPVISADGRYVAFFSRATNLVSGDTNGTADIFVRDVVAGTTTRVSVDSAGNQADDSSSGEGISADGRYVAFSSRATNLVAGDTNAVSDIFVHDRFLGLTERVSVDSAGNQANGASVVAPTISDDGRYVAFASSASNLVAGDTNGKRDIFVRDRDSGTTTRVSVDSLGNEANDRSPDQYGDAPPLISGDGRYVAFVSAASNLVDGDTNDEDDVFVHDRVTGTTERVSVGTGGGQGARASANPSMSSDGRFVLFDTPSNLTGGYYGGVFLRDRVNAVTRRLVHHPDAGTETRWTALSLSGDATHAVVRMVTDYLTNQNKYIVNDCSAAVCGDGSIVLGCESCDDGNMTDFDGCSSACALEPCHTCGGEPTVCTPHANGTACEDDNSCTPTQACSAGRCTGADVCLNMVCPGSPDPCVVSGTVELPDGGHVDLGGRSLRVATSGRVSSAAAGGSFALRNAGGVVAESGSLLITSGSGVDGGTIGIDSSGPCTLGGRIASEGKLNENFDGGAGGAVVVSCEGIELTTGSSIEADGVFGPGGTIRLAAGGGALTASGAYLSARGRAWDGGTIDLSAGGSCDVQAAAHVNSLVYKSDGERFFGSGGTVRASCDAGLQLRPRSSLILSSIVDPDGFANSGALSLESSGGDVVVSEGTKIENHGTDPGFQPTVMSILAGGMCRLGGSLQAKNVGRSFRRTASMGLSCADVILDPSLKLRLSSNDGRGGALIVEATGACDLNGKLKLDGRGKIQIGRGGDFSVICEEGVHLGKKAQVDASGKGSSFSTGGKIALVATRGNTTVAGKLAANGKARGGDISVEGCDVAFDQGKSFANGATGGSHTVIAREDLDIRGPISAKGKSMAGVNDLRYRSALHLPKPKLIAPAPVLAQDATLAPCP